ncbi:MAG: VOC family protein [Ginsengibacter sp.]
MKLDHVVYFTNSTPLQIVAEQQKLGRHAVVGGHHEKWGTQNALMYSYNAYVEWLSVERKDIAKKASHPLTDLLLYDLETGEGWGTLCISVEGIEQFNLEIKKKGFLTSGVFAAERKTPEGQVRKWRMLFIDQPLLDQLPLPFFIEWEEAENVRFAKLRKDGVFLAANENLEIRECVFRVEDPSKEIIKWANLLSQKISDFNLIILSNVVFKFITPSKNGKERLSDLIIETIKKT